MGDEETDEGSQAENFSATKAKADSPFNQPPKKGLFNRLFRKDSKASNPQDSATPDQAQVATETKPPEQAQEPAKEKKDPEQQVATELSADIQQILKIKDYLRVNGQEGDKYKDTERQSKLLALMDKIEAYKAEFGSHFAKTIGSGLDRVIIFITPVPTTVTEPAFMSIKDRYSRDQEVQVGEMTTSSNKFMYVNREGVRTYDIHTKQELEVDPESEYFKTSRDNDPERTKKWAKDASDIVKGNGQREKDMFYKLIDMDDYPEDPGKDLRSSMPSYEYKTPEGKKKVDEWDAKSKFFWYAKHFQPEASRSAKINEEYDKKQYPLRPPGRAFIPGDFYRRHGFDTGGGSDSQVTNPEFADEVIKTNIAQATRMKQAGY